MSIGVKVEESATDVTFGSEHGEVESPVVKRALMRVMPGARRQALLGTIRSVRYRGEAVECPCCGSTFSRFAPHRGRDSAKCPRCGALERHRALWLYLERETDLLDPPGSLLHIAPEYAFRRRLRTVDGLRYVTGDFDSALADHQLDVMDLPFEDESFDRVICNHVLEHVDDDRLALSEIRRVLAPGVGDPDVPGRPAARDDARRTPRSSPPRTGTAHSARATTGGSTAATIPIGSRARASRCGSRTS